MAVYVFPGVDKRASFLGVPKYPTNPPRSRQYAKEYDISNPITQTVSATRTQQRRHNRLRKRFLKFISQRRTIRYGLLVGNFLVLASIIAFVVHDTGAPNVALQPFLSASNSATVDPLDQLSSADIAANISRAAQLPEATAVTNQADTVKAEMAVTANNNVVTKPQVIAAALKSRRDIQTYITKDGDNVTNIAAKFNVTSDSIRWSNDLTSDAVGVGVKLSIPPVNGIVYTVKPGDTPQSLATKFNANADQITAYNDAEINGLKPGEQIIVPNGQIQRPVYASRPSYGFSFGTSAIYGYNGYDWGFCTWYVANRIAVPNNWGNANTWDNLAVLSGWTVSSVPRPGAIAQTDRGTFGHVAYVEEVSADGSQIKYSDMNGLAGFGRVGRSDWVDASKFPHYIYR